MQYGEPTMKGGRGGFDYAPTTNLDSAKILDLNKAV
jgi:hypothetical protein